MIRKIRKVIKGHKHYLTYERLLSVFGYKVYFSKESKVDCELGLIKKPYCLACDKEEKGLLVKTIFRFNF